MKLKDLNTVLSGKDSVSPRSVNIGPLGNRLNFIYGENGSGKSTIRQLIRDALVDHGGAAPRTLTNGQSLRLVIENKSGAYSIARDVSGLTTTPVNLLGVPETNGFSRSLDGSQSNSQPRMFHIDRALADCFSFVAFRHAGPELQNLHAAIHQRLQVPVGKDAASNDAGVSRQQQEQLQTRIALLQTELSQSIAQRTLIETEVASGVGDGQRKALEIDRQIAELMSRIAQLDPLRIRQEIESLQQESARLRLEISQTPVRVSQPDSSAEVVLLYRLLDAIDQQIRESRAVQSNIQRHRVRLKEQLEQLSHMTIEEPGHPYHRAREILHQIEIRIDNTDTRGDQWLDDHGTVDAQQVSRFIDETCNSLRTDLQSLCDELSSQYHEMRSRSAAEELKELRHTYAHLSDLIQQSLSRREGVIAEIFAADPAGADLIRREDPQFSEIAIGSGHYAARQQLLGSLQRAPVEVARDTSLQQQQLAALENRLSTLTSSLGLADSEQLRLTGEIRELESRKIGLNSVLLAERQERLNQIIAKINNTESQIHSLSTQLQQWETKLATPSPLLISASSTLSRLTNGDYVKVWLGSVAGSFGIQNRQGQEFESHAITERGLLQLVQLSLVLAANEQAVIDAPIMLDDLFADVRKERVDVALQTLSKWCHDRQRQVVVLTQHRFLADRIAEAPVWEIEPTAAPTPAARRPEIASTVSIEKTYVETPVTPASTFTAVVEARPQEIHPLVAVATAPVADYPSKSSARPYPFSKYPHNSNREQVDATEGVDYHSFGYHESFVQPEVQVEMTPKRQNGFIEVNPSARASVISPAEVGDRYHPVSISESTSIESVTLFDNAQLRCLQEHGIKTVLDFLQLDPKSDAEDFSACYLVGQSLEFLQSAIWLMCWVPNLVENDAQALVACGISDPEHLLTSNIDSLFERLTRFMRSPDGRRFGGAERSLSRNSVRSWQLNLRNNRDYHRQGRPRGGRTSQQQDQSSERHSLRAWSPSQRRDSDRQQSERGDRNGHDQRRQSSERNGVRERGEQDGYREPSERYEHRQREERSERVQRHPTSSRGQRMQPPLPTDTVRSPSILPPMQPRAPKKPAAVRQTATRHSLMGTGPGETGFAETEPKSPAKAKSKSSTAKLRFYLELADHIEAAPSIGPKTGARFEAIGVHTIQDFLKMTAESMAERLDYKRLSAKVLRQWQNQTRLVCRIPNLRGHDAQLLVGCGIIEAEELASMRPEGLFAKIAPFSDTKEGLKIIRNGKKPDLAEVTDWISFAQHNRSLQAA